MNLSRLIGIFVFAIGISACSTNKSHELYVPGPDGTVIPIGGDITEPKLRYLGSVENDVTGDSASPGYLLPKENNDFISQFDFDYKNLTHGNSNMDKWAY